MSIAVLLAAAAGAIGLLDDARWVAPTVLFWLVVVAASLCVVAAVAVGVLAFRLGQAELAIVSAFFFAASVLPLVHGLTVPGVLYDDNAVTMTSVFLAIPVGGLAAATVGWAARPGRSPADWRRALIAAYAMCTVLSAGLLAAPQIDVHPEPGSTPAVLYALGAFGITVRLGWRHVRLAVIAERSAPMVVAFGYVLLGASALLFLGASMWSTYFWMAHAVDIVGVFLATIGALVVYRRHGSIASVIAPISALDSRTAFEYGLTPIVHRFVADLDAKDRMTRDHVVRTGALAIDVAETLYLDPDTVRRCGLVGLLHDVGKLEIPDEVLTKPGRLTDAEFEIIQGHTHIGARLVEATPVLADLGPAVRAHHERLDGRGYPDGLTGRTIPIVARVVSVCDAYDAMAFTRHYREGMDEAKVRAILTEHAGSQWDADVVEALLRVVDNRPDDAIWALDAVGTSGVDAAEVAPIGCDCLPADSLA